MSPNSNLLGTYAIICRKKGADSEVTRSPSTDTYPLSSGCKPKKACSKASKASVSCACTHVSCPSLAMNDRSLHATWLPTLMVASLISIIHWQMYTKNIRINRLYRDKKWLSTGLMPHSIFLVAYILIVWAVNRFFSVYL